LIDTRLPSSWTLFDSSVESRECAIGERIGYQRVSTVDQNTDRQLDGVAVDKLFTDKASGMDTNRPELA
jgi:hypothetical protein